MTERVNRFGYAAGDIVDPNLLHPGSGLVEWGRARVATLEHLRGLQPFLRHLRHTGTLHLTPTPHGRYTAAWQPDSMIPPAEIECDATWIPRSSDSSVAPDGSTVTWRHGNMVILVPAEWAGTDGQILARVDGRPLRRADGSWVIRPVSITPDLPEPPPTESETP